MRELSVDKLVEYFEKLDADKINRRYFHLPGKPEVKQEVVKQGVKQEEVEERIPKYTRLRDVYSEEDYEHNMALVARSFFDFLEKDKKISVLLIREAAKPKKEIEKEIKAEEAGVAIVELEPENKTKKQKAKVPRTELRRQHIKDMLDTWFPAWAHIQSLPFTHPTATLRSEEDLLTVQQTGVL